MAHSPNIPICQACPHGADNGRRPGPLSTPCTASPGKSPWFELAKKGYCPLGKFPAPGTGTKYHSVNVQKRQPSPTKPISEWPAIARAIYRRRKAGETGVGDTVARWIGKAGGEKFKAVYKRITGHDCGCANRQAALNQMFPYPDDNFRT